MKNKNMVLWTKRRYYTKTIELRFTNEKKTKKPNNVNYQNQEL